MPPRAEGPYPASSPCPVAIPCSPKRFRPPARPDPANRTSLEEWRAPYASGAGAKGRLMVAYVRGSWANGGDLQKTDTPCERPPTRKVGRPTRKNREPTSRCAHLYGDDERPGTAEGISKPRRRRGEGRSLTRSAPLAKPVRMVMPRRPHRQATAVTLLRPGTSEEARSEATGQGDRHRRRRGPHRHGRHRTGRMSSGDRQRVGAPEHVGSGERADARHRRKEVRAARS